MKAELVPLNGDPPIPITRDLTIVGRREYCDVQLDFHGVSKRHCVVVKTDGLLVIRDLATTNGTRVNGQRIRWAALLPNDKVMRGGYKMRVYLGSDDAPTPSEKGFRDGPPVAQAPAAATAAAAASPGPPAAPKPAPARKAPAARNGKPKVDPDDGFAAPSPLAAPLLSREDLEDVEWASDDDLVDDDAPGATPLSPPAIANDDDAFIIELD
jgi:predicted component of type VI protein secretion system